jgi:CPA1 family monovalent cation:H+ antiporter
MMVRKNFARRFIPIKTFTLVLLVGILFSLVLTSCAPTEDYRAAVSTPVETTQSGETLQEPAGTEAEIAADAEIEEEADNFIRIEEVVIGLLLLAAVVSIITERARIPYTVGLVLVGLGIALVVRNPLQTTITPELILALLVPPLIFEAAFHIDVRDLRRDITLILMLAVPGVVITMILVSGVLTLATPLPIYPALIFGALIAATDPVAVIALFRTLGAPKRLQVLLEGESLFNDGTAIVLFSLILSIAGLRPLTIAGLNLSFEGTLGILSVIPVFLIVSVGGLVVGGILGIIASQLIERIDNYLIEITLTTVLAYGAFLVAEEVLHVSGVLAVVAAGLAAGNTGPKGMSPTTRIVLVNFWEYAAFLANSFVFLLIGLEIDLELFLQNWIVIVWAIIAVLVARAVSIYGLSWFGREVSTRWKTVMYWGGLRGAISLALALSLPFTTPNLGALKAMAFGVVLFTLLVQGLTMGNLLQRMGLVERDEAKDAFERYHARAVSLRAAYNRLEEMHRENLLTDYSWDLLSDYLLKKSNRAAKAIKESLKANPGLRADELIDAWREALQIQRSTLTELFHDGIINEATLSELTAEVDRSIQEPTSLWNEIPHPALSMAKVERLITAIVQLQDADNAVEALEELDVAVTRFPSVGGFLGRTNVTLLIGLPAGREETVVEALKNNCKRRVEFLAAPVEGSPIPLGSPIPVNVGGATIFAFDVERYEEF